MARDQSRLPLLLSLNDDFKKALERGEAWAVKRARQVDNLDHGVMHPEREFRYDKPKRHCSRCPFKEGCIMCDLP